MKDDASGPSSELDVLKFYIWLMAAMTVALGGFYWSVWNDHDAVSRNLDLGRKLMKDFETQSSEIQGMLKVHETNKEDAARDAPNSWFATVWRRKGIPDGSIQPGQWKVPARYDARGKFNEEQIDMQFLSKPQGLAREQIAEFCHEIEKSSTRLRVLELELHRVDKQNLEKDEWAGKALIGYRHPKQD
jgi:hypothetical protein